MSDLPPLAEAIETVMRVRGGYWGGVLDPDEQAALDVVIAAASNYSDLAESATQGASRE